MASVPSGGAIAASSGAAAETKAAEPAQGEIKLYTQYHDAGYNQATPLQKPRRKRRKRNPKTRRTVTWDSGCSTKKLSRQFETLVLLDLLGSLLYGKIFGLLINPSQNMTFILRNKRINTGTRGQLLLKNW